MTFAKRVKISRLITEILSRAANYILFLAGKKASKEPKEVKIVQGQ